MRNRLARAVFTTSDQSDHGVEAYEAPNHVDGKWNCLGYSNSVVWVGPYMPETRVLSACSRLETGP